MARARTAERRLRARLDALPDPMVLLRALTTPAGAVTQHVFLDANPAACADLDLPRHRVIARRLADVMSIAVAERLEARLAQMRDAAGVLEVDDLPWLGGRVVDLRVVAVPDGLNVTWRDATDRHRTLADLADSQRRFRLLAENATDVVLLTDDEGVVTWASASVTASLGWRADDLVANPVLSLVHPDDTGDCHPTGWRRSIQRRRCRWRCRDGSYRWVEAIRRALPDEGDGVRWVVTLRDVHDEVRHAASLEQALAFDRLTGLPRRGVALTRLADLVQRRTDEDWAVLCVGVSGLTSINQAYTYAVGDRVLVEVSRRLVAAVDAQDHVARIAGDEFLVMPAGRLSGADAAAAASRLLAAVHGPFDVDGTLVDIAVNVGIALWRPGDLALHGTGDRAAEALVRDAAAAMRQAGLRGSLRWGFLDGDVAALSRSVLTLQSQLRQALLEDRLRPWFMPLVSLAAGGVVGYEALARWHREDGEVAGPDAFLTVAERGDLVIDIDRRVLGYALDMLTGLPAHQHVAVNVSATSLQSGHLPETVLAELRRTGIDPHRLHLEATETALLDVTSDVAGAMRRLAEAGVTWWVDDFGTGYSSIAHLRDLPIQGLKLDRTFTGRIADHDDDRPLRLAQGLAGLATGLGLRTVAEGVESLRQQEILRSQGWQTGQGWLYGRPQPVPEVLAR